MEWWSIFYQVRKAIFAFIAIVSLVLAVAFSVYTAHEWPHLLAAQRGIIFGIIAVNGLTALLLYLMIVVVFRVWLDLARVFFLLLIHTASALMFTLFGGNFSCDVFASKTECKHVDLAFIVASWLMTGLLLGYMIYLLIMLRVPRPIPRLTPNLLLDGPDLSRRGSIESVKSVNSATGLLRADSRRSVGSYRAQSPSLRYYVVNASPSDSPFSPTGPATPRPMTQIAQLPATQTSFSGGVGVRRSGSTHPSLPPALALTNPFLDPPRHGTPDSFVSNLTFSSSAASSSTHTQPHWTSLGLEKYSPIVPLPPDEKTRLYPHTARPSDAPDSPKSFYSAHSNVYEYGTHDQHQHPHLPVQMWSAGASLRAHTNTPHSIHSVAPSMHHCHAAAAAAVLPAPEPVFRPHSAAARLDHRSSLPNPFAMVGNDVRRYGSVPNGQYHHHAHAQQQQQQQQQQRQHRVAPLHGGHVHGGQGGTYVSARNAAHLAGALGKTPPRAEGATQGSEQWRQLVLSAARGRSS